MNRTVSVAPQTAGAPWTFSLRDGLIAGGLAGLALGMVGMIGTLIMGQGLFWPLVVIGRAFGPRTDTPSQDAGTIVLGLVYHMVLSMMLGVAFALAARALPRALPLWVWGLLFGVAILLVDQLGLLALVDPTMTANLNQWLLLVMHVAFGMVLGGYLQWRAGQTTTTV